MGGIAWVGSPNHYDGRDGHKVTHITLHTMAGFLAGTDSVFSSSSSQASAHYGIGANGEIHQYVDEANGSWSDANYLSNMSTISIEHEGGIPQAQCTQACINASARLCADISQRYGLGMLWHDGTRGNIWLHREISGTDHATCPDLAPNGLPYQEVIDKANEIIGGNMALTNEDIMKIWTHKLPNGACVRDCLSPAIEDVIAMHDTGLQPGTWLHKLPNGRYARDIIGDATSDVIRIHDTMLPQLTAQVAALSSTVETLAKNMGADPDKIAQLVQDAVTKKLESLKITVE